MKTTLYSLLILTVFCGNPASRIETRTVDLIELNHKLDKNNGPVFDQIIFWRRRPSTGWYEVQDYVMKRESSELLDGPVFSASRNMYEVRLMSPKGAPYMIQSRLFRESWTFDDPEVEDKRFCPVECRLKVRK